MKSCESFLRKSQFCTLTDLNPGFGGPLDMLGIFLVNYYLHNALKEVFRPKKIWILNTSSKVPFWQFFNSGKMAVLNPCMKFKNYFGRKTSFESLWRWHLLKISLTCPKVRQIQNLGQSEYKKDSQDFKNYFQLGFLWIPSKTGKQN